MPFTNSQYCSHSGRLRPSRMRFASMTAGVHDFPHVSAAGSAGSALNSRKTKMLSRKRIRTPVAMRRIT